MEELKNDDYNKQKVIKDFEKELKELSMKLDNLKAYKKTMEDWKVEKD